MTADAIQAYFLAESDRRDRELTSRLNAWREGWNACQTALSDAYEDGYSDALLTIKHGHHDTVRAAQQLRDWTIAEEAIETARWGPGGRQHFAGLRPGDYQGGPVPAW